MNRFLAGLLGTSPERRAFLERLYALPRRMGDILAMLRTFRESKIFLSKVSKKDAPNYYDVIRHPMDLGTVQRKIGMYRTFEEFKADLDLIWSNCLEFNEGRYYRECALKMRDVARTLEIERLAVRRDEELPWMLDVQGGCNGGPVARLVLRKAMARILVETGYSRASRAALEVFSDVVGNMILKITSTECTQ